MGIILQPAALVAQDLLAGRLVPVLPGYAAPALPVHLLTAPGRLRTLKLQSFVDYVEVLGPWTWLAAPPCADPAPARKRFEGGHREQAQPRRLGSRSCGPGAGLWLAIN